MGGVGGRRRIGWMNMFLIGILLNFFIGEGSSIYFSQPEVNLTRTFIPDSGFLYVVKAIAKTSEDGQIQYSISAGSVHREDQDGEARTTNAVAESSKCLELIIDKNLGNISVSLSSQEASNDLPTGTGQFGLSCVYTVTARLDGKAKQKTSKEEEAVEDDDEAETKLILNTVSPLAFLPSTTSDCKSLSKKELCFGGANHLELRVMENSPATPVVYLGSLPGMCGTLKVSYNVSISEGALSANLARNYHPLTNVIQSKANLDREEIEKYDVSINCIVEYPEEPNRFEVIGVGGRLVVLDENDNVAVWGEDALSAVTISISLADHGYKMKPGERLKPKEHTDLLAEDQDTLDVNNVQIYSVNDTKGLLEFRLLQHAISKDLMKNSTAIVVQIVLSDHVEGIQPWEGYYCVQSVINDSTVIAPKRGQDLKYTVCISWGQEPHPPKPSERPSMDALLNRLSNRVVTARLPRSAQKYAPVLYPFPDLIEDWSETMPDVDFTLTHLFASVEETTYVDSNSNNEDDFVMVSSDYAVTVFEVTPKMGIIHLINPEFIRNSSFHSFHLQLHCNSSLIRSFSTNITITLESAVNNETICDDELCAVHADSKTCELACGYASRGNCVWSQESGFQNSLNSDDVLEQSPNAPSYPTCTPYLRTCPDGKCDEMEQMFPHLCPQDCASEVQGFARLIKRSNGKSHGIDGQYCKGVGSCQDQHTCSCGHLPPPIVDSSTSYEHRPTGGTLAVSTPADSECGQQCVMLYMAVGLIASVLTMFGVYIWKKRVERKRKSRSLNQSVMMTANGIELPYGDNTGHGTLMSDAEYMARGLSHPGMLVSDDQFAQHQIVQVDSKWEICRDDLLLEHILGEGQFGRVLKGRLHGQAVGHIPVAVKMLKVDATEGSKSLWQEFMAEFSLLKQVDHPNVIKLLGACTTTGGPPYLVMEYAEYGALRSFLRKCRRVEKINGSHSALHWDHGDLSTSTNSEAMDLDYIVTPREVLGFSWQIAKGMAYLSDMKMVHRDLAARNILLTKLKVCKISDFGLTRDIYVDDAYQKKSKDRVPVKWLAPECLADELYTTKSDVWAFGILVWELTTLGASPYPGIQTEQLYSLLNAGYRMPQPQNCSNELYSLMRRCWAYQPSNRPTFHQIVLELSKMLEDGIEYLKLDVPSVSNPGYDYFSQSERTGSEVVNLSPINTSPLAEGRPLGRRKLSMENLRLIDYEISTDDEFLSKRNSDSHAVTKHTYINDPKPSEQDCSKVKPSSVVSSSGYESPIRSATSVPV